MKRALNADDANKKARSEPAPAAAEDPHAKYSAEFEQIAMAQDEIEKLNAEASEETLKIERKFAEKKKPHMRRRNDICTKIPGFWLSCFKGHKVLSEVVGEEDEGLLTHLSDLWVEETDNSFKIIFKFSKEASAWLDGDTLWKEFKGEPGGSVSVSSSPLKWKAGKDLVAKAAEQEDGMTFFQWFGETEEEDELAQIIRDEIWSDPVVFFGVQPGDDDDDDDDDDEEAEED